MDYFFVKNWRVFQHYKDRNPPWIKLHFEILSSEDWVNLDDKSRVLAIACMLIASKNEGKVPNNPKYLQRVAYLNTLPNFKPLLDCGFFEKMLANDSGCKQEIAEFRPETETYSKETETENRCARKNHTPVQSVNIDIIAEWAKENIPSNIKLEWELAKFKDHQWRKGEPKDGIKAFKNWLRQSVDYKNNSQNNKTKFSLEEAI